MEISLNEQQRELVEKNHNLIYKFAHKNNLSLDEYYDILAIDICNAAKKYDESKGAFSTLAYHCMRNTLFDYFRHLNSNKVIPNGIIMSYDAHNNNDGEDCSSSYLNSIADCNRTDDIVISNIIMNEFYNTLTNIEKIIVNLLIEGLRQSDISRRIGCSSQNVSARVKKIRNKLEKYLKNID